MLEITKEEKLIELYINQSMSINAISQKYNCAYITVRNRLEKYDIPIRSRKEQKEKELEVKLGFVLTSDMIMKKINQGMFVYQVAKLLESIGKPSQRD